MFKSGAQFNLISIADPDPGDIFKRARIYTVCQRNRDPIYVVTYYINWVKTYWTYCKNYFKREIVVKANIFLIVLKCNFIWLDKDIDI